MFPPEALSLQPIRVGWPAITFAFTITFAFPFAFLSNIAAIRTGLSKTHIGNSYKIWYILHNYRVNFNAGFKYERVFFFPVRSENGPRDR